jgi:hypothetical protein
MGTVTGTGEVLFFKMEIWVLSPCQPTSELTSMIMGSFERDRWL